MSNCFRIIEIMEYNSQNHSCFCLKSHVIFATKYRKRIIKNDIKISLETILNNMKYDFVIEEFESDFNHLHLLVDYPPKLSLLSIVRIIKQITTVGLWKQHSRYLQKCYWKERTFWNDGYFCSSVGGVNIEVVKKYIENQSRNSSTRLKT